MEGFERGRNLEKVGRHSQDTAELFFTDVRVPSENLLGEESRFLLHDVQFASRETQYRSISCCRDTIRSI